MATPLPITQLPPQYGSAGTSFVWTAGDSVNDNEFQSTGFEILLAYNADVATAGLIVVAVNATGGTWTATYGGQMSGAIQWNASPNVGGSSVQTLLNAITGAPVFTVTGVATTSGHSGIYVIQGPVGTVLTALTTGVGSLTGGSTSADVFAGPVGSAGTSHAHTIKSVADSPEGRTGDITETLAAGVYKAYQMFPEAGYANAGFIQENPASAMIEYVVLRVP